MIFNEAISLHSQGVNIQENQTIQTATTSFLRNKNYTHSYAMNTMTTVL
jgi:hypothetical protein